MLALPPGAMRQVESDRRILESLEPDDRVDLVAIAASCAACGHGVLTREPNPTSRRQGTDMPHIPDHATHDQELVAAYASGDAAGGRLEAATALVASCAECAALHHDLRLIAAALSDLPAPVRPRDFRLTPGQAAALQPTGWRRLLGAFAGPSFRFAAPLGAGLAALGLAGILVGNLAGLPLGMGGAVRQATDTSALAPTAGSTLAPEGPAHASDGAPAPAASPVPVSGGGDTAGGSTAPPATQPPGSPGTEAFNGAAQGEPGSKSIDDANSGPTVQPAGGTLVVAGGAALLAGLVLLGLRWASRRLA